MKFQQTKEVLNQLVADLSQMSVVVHLNTLVHERTRFPYIAPNDG